MRPNHPMPIRTGHTFLAYNPKMTSDQQTVNSEQRTTNSEQRTVNNEQWVVRSTLAAHSNNT